MMYKVEPVSPYNKREVNTTQEDRAQKALLSTHTPEITKITLISNLINLGEIDLRLLKEYGS